MYFDFDEDGFADDDTLKFVVTALDGTTELADPVYGLNSEVRGDATGDYPNYDTWIGFKEATAATPGAPLAERLGNYVVFRNLSSTEFRVEVYDDAGQREGRRYMNAIQIVEVPNAAPAFTTHPQPVTVVEGGQAVFTVETSGYPAPTYQWQKDGSPLSGETGSTLTLSSVTSTDEGDYTVVATNSEGSATSDAASLTVNPLTAPMVTAHPQSQTVTEQDPVTFTVTATGAPAPTYQWRKDGVAIVGATSDTYTIASASSGDAGTYDVLVSNSEGSTGSDPATLTVDPLPPEAPAISSQPQSLTVTEGESASFTVTASGNPLPTYQWRKDGADLTGETGSSLSIASASVADAGDYEVVVTNSEGTVTSSIATLTVNAAPSGSVLLAEFFDYGSSNQESGYGEWADGSSIVDYIGGTNLSFSHAAYDGTPNVGGSLKAISYGDPRGAQLAVLESAAEGSFWISAILEVSSSSSGDWGLLGLNDAGSYSQSSPNGGAIGLAADGGTLKPAYRAPGGTLTFGSRTGYSTGGRYLLLAKVGIGAGNDTLSLWIMQSGDNFDATEASLGTPHVSVAAADFGAGLLNIWAGAASTNLEIDAIRISSNPGDTGLADVLGAAGAATPPAAASGLTATTVSDTAIDLTWTDNSDDETGFKVMRSTTSGSGFSLLTTTAADATSYSDTGLSASTEYFYQIVATNGDGDASASNEDSATTQAPAGNQTPVANAQTVATYVDTPLGITLTGSDGDDDPLTYAVASGPSNGLLSGTAPNLTYTPSAAYEGSDSFTFTVNDGTDTSAPATVSINVIPQSGGGNATFQDLVDYDGYSPLPAHLYSPVDAEGTPSDYYPGNAPYPNPKNGQFTDYGIFKRPDYQFLNNSWIDDVTARMESEGVPRIGSRLFFNASNGETLGYYLLLPDGYDPQDTGTTYPLLIVNHGSGSLGSTDPADEIKFMALAENRAAYPCIVVSPTYAARPVDQEVDGEDRQLVTIEPPFVAMTELVDHLIANEQVDTDRVYASGFSMGGATTMALLFERPNLLAAASPWAGYNGFEDPSRDAAAIQAFSDTAVWMVIGDQDFAGTPYGTGAAYYRGMYQRMRDAGHPAVKLWDIPGADHMEIYRTMFPTYYPHVLDWMFAQSKGGTVDKGFMHAPYDLSVETGEDLRYQGWAFGRPGATGYQWKRNGVDVPGATSAELILENITQADSGDYTVTAGFASGDVTSPAGTLTVAAPAAPVITTAPASTTTSEFENVTLTVEATGSYPRTYQWSHNGSPVGTDTPSLELSDLRAADAGTYAVTVLNSEGSDSASATLTVNYVVPSFTQHPLDVTAPAGDAVTLSGSATGSQPITYQWRKDGVDLSGETASTLSLDPAQASDSGDYTLVATNAGGTTVSDPATVQITAADFVVNDDFSTDTSGDWVLLTDSTGEAFSGSALTYRPTGPPSQTGLTTSDASLWVNTPHNGTSAVYGVALFRPFAQTDLTGGQVFTDGLHANVAPLTSGLLVRYEDGGQTRYAVSDNSATTTTGNGKTPVQGQWTLDSLTWKTADPSDWTTAPGAAVDGSVVLSTATAVGIYQRYSGSWMNYKGPVLMSLQVTAPNAGATDPVYPANASGQFTLDGSTLYYYLPDTFDAGTATPVMVYMRGAGTGLSRPDDFITALETRGVTAVVVTNHNSYHHIDFPAMMTALSGLGFTLEPKPYLTGFSRGGQMSHRLALQLYADDLMAVAPQNQGSATDANGVYFRQVNYNGGQITTDPAGAEDGIPWTGTATEAGLSTPAMSGAETLPFKQVIKLGDETRALNTHFLLHSVQRNGGEWVDSYWGAENIGHNQTLTAELEVVDFFTAVRDAGTNRPPSVTLAGDAVRILNSGEEVTFSASAVDPQGGAVSYEWRQISHSNPDTLKNENLYAYFQRPDGAAGRLPMHEGTSLTGGAVTSGSLPLVLSTTDSLTFTPPAVSVDTPVWLEVKALDAEGLANTASVLVVINGPPALQEGAAATHPVLAGRSSTFPLTAFDADSANLSWTITTTPANGQAALNTASGEQVTLTYTPTAGWTGTDQVEVTCTDSSGLSSTTTLTLQVGTGSAGVPASMDAVQVTNFSSLTAYGASPVLNTRDADIGNWNDLDEVYIRFPLDGVASGSLSGELRLAVVSNPAGTTTSFELQEVEEDGFGELDSSWGFIPTPIGAVLDTLTVSDTGMVELDVGASVEQALTRGDTSITYRLKRTGTSGSNPGCSFASRSHDDSAKRPALVMTYVEGDADVNGIPNEWEQRWYGAPAAAPGTVTKNGREVSTYDVYVWGLDPTDENAVLEPMQAGPDGAGGFSFRIPTANERSYAVQYTDDLTQPGGGWQDLPGADAIAGDGTELTVTDPNPGSGRFYRIRVWVP